MSKILKRSDPRPSKTEVVDIPEWGGSVRIGCLPVSILFSSKDGPEKEREVSIQSILACVFDEEGQPFFSGAEEVERLDLPIFTRLQTAIATLSNPDPKQIEKN